MTAPVHIGKVLRNAVIFNARRSHAEAMNAEGLLDAAARLFALLAERRIDYLLVGGVALLQYVQARNTEDVDLLIGLPSLKLLPEIAITSQDDNFARGSLGALQIDFRLTCNPFFDMVQRRYATVKTFQERDVPCATVEGLLALKLYALPSLYRQGNFARVALYETDIVMLIHEYQPAVGPLLEQLEHYLSPSDMASLRDIVAEIQQRIDRFRRGLGES